jgi:hypothetical protein
VCAKHIPFFHCVYDYESSGAALHHYVDRLHELKRQFGWKYGNHYFPHDVKNQELISDLSRIDMLHSLGVEATVVPRHHLLDGINATRRLLDRTRIDPVKCERGLDCLKNYRREWKKETRNGSQGEVRDWTNHGADALRYFATGYSEPSFKPRDDRGRSSSGVSSRSSHWAA